MTSNKYVLYSGDLGRIYNGLTMRPAWLMPIHGTKLKIWSALFTRHYLQSVCSGHIPDEVVVVVFSTQEYNLKYDDEKVMALINWVKSGQAKHLQMQMVLGL